MLIWTLIGSVFRKMNHKTPYITVIIPAYNSGKFISQAVQSVLEQDCAPYEVLVIDDGSTDDTKAVLSQFDKSIKYFYQENRGPSSARNMGINMAKGEYIAFLDADDLWAPGKLEVQLEFLESHRDIGLVFSDIEQFDEEKILERPCIAEQVFEPGKATQVPLREAFVKLLIKNFIPTNTVMVRRECFKKAGLFDEGLRIVEDRDMWLRIAAHFKVARIPLVLCKRRLHGSNISGDQERYISSLITVLEKNLCLFPDLVPSSLVNRELSRLYIAYGYDMLLKNRKKESRQMAFHSLSLTATIKAFELILLTFTGQITIQFLRGIKRGLSGVEK